MSLSATWHEDMLLAAVLSQPAILDEIGEIGELLEQRCARAAHRAAAAQWADHRAIDISSLMRDVGDDETRSYLMSLDEISGLLAADGYRVHLARVRDAAQRRRLTDSAVEVMRACEADDLPAHEIAAQMQADVDEAMAIRQASIVGLDELMAESSDDAPATVIPTGLPMLDRYLGGWIERRYAVVAARPAVGKSALGLHAALHAALHDHPVAILSSEMSRHDVRSRMVASYGQLDHEDVQAVMRDWSSHRGVAAADVMSCMGDLARLPIAIDDRAVVSPSDARALVLETRRRYGRCDLLVVDYLQRLIPPSWVRPHAAEHERIGAVSTQLQSIAKEQSVAVLALAQLNRQVEADAKTPRRPRKSDLRGSGVIEQDADVLLFLWHASDADRLADVSQLVMTVDKHRHGRTGEINLVFHRPTQTMRERRA